MPSSGMEWTANEYSLDRPPLIMAIYLLVDYICTFVHAYIIRCKERLTTRKTVETAFNPYHE